MNAEVFLDPNILLYACSAAPADADEQRCAEALILGENFGLSAQVLQQFIANALRKPALGMSEAAINATLELASHVRCCPSPGNSWFPPRLCVVAISFRTGTPPSSPRLLPLGFRTLYSDHLSHGQSFGSVEVINPFAWCLGPKEDLGKPDPPKTCE